MVVSLPWGDTKKPPGDSGEVLMSLELDGGLRLTPVGFPEADPLRLVSWSLPLSWLFGINPLILEQLFAGQAGVSKTPRAGREVVPRARVRQVRCCQLPQLGGPGPGHPFTCGFMK